VTSSSAATLQIVVIEDDPGYRASLATLLQHAPGFALAASFAAPEEAIAEAERIAASERPACWDLAVCDLHFGDGAPLDGVDAVGRLKAHLPELRVVMLTVFEEAGTILRAICAGADGYLLKKASAREILAQLRAVAQGGAPMTPGVARAVLDLVRRYAPATPAASAPRSSKLDLTEREREVLRCLVAGQAYKEVADTLGVALDTVRSHIRALYKKLQVHGAAEAVSRALRDGLV
jgi:DNA-binding NarL/FixJ family response regulator